MISASNSPPTCCGHEGDFLPFHQLALGLGGPALGFGGLEPQRVQFLRYVRRRSGQGRARRAAGDSACEPPCLGDSAASRGTAPRHSDATRALPPSLFKRRFKDAVHDQVRIAADGRSEMRVGGRGQGEVADVLFRVARLLERAQHQIGKDALLGFALDALGEPLVMERTDLQFALNSLVKARVAVALVAKPHARAPRGEATRCPASSRSVAAISSNSITFLASGFSWMR